MSIKTISPLASLSSWQFCLFGGVRVTETRKPRGEWGGEWEREREREWASFPSRLRRLPVRSKPPATQAIHWLHSYLNRL